MWWLKSQIWNISSMTWPKILWKLGSPAALSYARSATGRQNRAPSVWAAFQVQVNVTLFVFFIYREWKVTITTFTKFQTPNFERMFWGLHHQWICKKPSGQVMTRLPASVTQLKVSKALLRLSTSNCNPQRRLVNFRFSARSLCWNVGWTVVAWLYIYIQDIKMPKKTSQFNQFQSILLLNRFHALKLHHVSAIHVFSGICLAERFRSTLAFLSFLNVLCLWR